VTSSELRQLVAAAVLACVVALVVAHVTVVFSFPDIGFGESGLGRWYFRLHALDFTYEVLALGAIGYALPPQRLTTLALRVAGALAVVAVAAEVVEWIAEFDSPFARASGGVGARAVMHLAELAAAIAVVAAWYVTERASRTIDA
jgi:hypothetical protein